MLSFCANMATYARDTKDIQPTAVNDLDLPEPARSLEECDAILTAPGAFHELAEATINGRSYRVFKNLPPSLRALWLALVAQYSDREYLVLGKERVTYGEVGASMFEKSQTLLNV